MKELSIEERELLFKDLSARLPYGVIVQYPDIFRPSEIVKRRLEEISCSLIGIDEYKININDDGVDIEYIKPYLRTMSSMTEDEMKEYYSLIEEQKNMSYFTFCSCVTRYLDSIHVDHRAIKDKDGKWKTMIQLGLALEAPKGMYK